MYRVDTDENEILNLERPKSRRRAVKFAATFIGILTASIMLTAACTRESDFPVLRGPYLGQSPPGTTPEVFAPGIVSTDLVEADAAFARNSEVLLFNRIYSDRPYDIYITELRNDRWTEPAPVPFGNAYNEWDFKFAPDDRTLFYTSVRPKSGVGPPLENANIWSTELTDSGWTEPVMLPGPVNTDMHEAYPSVTLDGTLYLFTRRNDTHGRSDLYRSRIRNGEYQELENLGDRINTEHSEVDAFVAPDESYLIFCSDRPGGYGMWDLYVSFKNGQGEWAEAVNMGEPINSVLGETTPSVTLDNRYLFFTVGEDGSANIYWVDAGVIETLRPEGY